MTKVNSNPYFIFFANSIVVQKNRNTITKYQLITPFGFLPPPHGYESIICTEDSPEWSIKCTWLAAKVSLSWFFCLPRQLADLISLLFWWLISSAKILITIFSYFKCPMTHQFSSSVRPANRLCFNQGRQTSQCHQSVHCAMALIVFFCLKILKFWSLEVIMSQNLGVTRPWSLKP